MPPRPSRSMASPTSTRRTRIALERLKTEFKGKVEVLPLPVRCLRDLRKLSAEVVREESEKTPMARKVHASYSKFQALVGPWDHVAEGAYHRLVAQAEGRGSARGSLMPGRQTAGWIRGSPW